MKRNNLLQTVLLVAVTSVGLWAARQTPDSIARSLLEPLLESARDSPEEGSAILPILRGLADDGSVSLTEERRSRVMAGSGDVPPTYPPRISRGHVKAYIGSQTVYTYAPPDTSTATIATCLAGFAQITANTSGTTP